MAVSLKKLMVRTLRGLTAACWAAVVSVETASAWAAPASSPPPPKMAPPRVASATVCADQYVLALADPGQVAAVSPKAAESWLSLMAPLAAGHPALRPSAEAYLDAGVDVVVTNAWSDHQTAALLERFGVTVVRLPMPDTYDGVAQATRAVARAIGQEQRGEALVSEMWQRLDAVADRAPGRGRDALYLRPGGGTAGAGTFIDAVMGTVGLGNHATREGLRGWGRYSLEQFIAHPPGMLVTSFFNPPHPGATGAFGEHPAFRRRAATLPRAQVPGAMWACGAWILAVAAERLADEVSP